MHTNEKKNGIKLYAASCKQRIYFSKLIFNAMQQDFFYCTKFKMIRKTFPVLLYLKLVFKHYLFQNIKKQVFKTLVKRFNMG